MKNIREIHILEPWYHLKKLEQVIGRGVRYCSHKDLEEHEKNVTIYLYASLIRDQDINIDIDIYSKAEKKSNEINLYSQRHYAIDKIQYENFKKYDKMKDFTSISKDLKDYI